MGDTQFRTGATRWGAHRSRLMGSHWFRRLSTPMNRCDNCRIKSAHYCVIGIRGGIARYYDCSMGPRNGGPTRRLVSSWNSMPPLVVSLNWQK